MRTWSQICTRLDPAGYWFLIDSGMSSAEALLRLGGTGNGKGGKGKGKGGKGKGGGGKGKCGGDKGNDDLSDVGPVGRKGKPMHVS